MYECNATNIVSNHNTRFCSRLAELESDRYEALLEGLDYFDSPVNKYLLTKRLTLDWERVENIMQHDSGKSNVNHIYCIIHNLHFASYYLAGCGLSHVSQI